MAEGVARSNPKAVLSTIAAVLEEDCAIEIHPIGASAVKRTVKAIALARYPS